MGRFIRRLAGLSGIVLWWIGSAVSAYEPSYEEILIKREQIERFCRLLDHQRRFDLCETQAKIKGKLPATTGELELLRRAQNRTTE